ncbi:MAG: chalcone isomerase family protein, partial [Candidatus Acidiferrum sp.]
VYSIASFVRSDVKVRNAAELASADVFKRLHLVMERDVAGGDMADAFSSAIRRNYPEPAFSEEVQTLVRMLQAGTARRGDSILLTHLPGEGLQIKVGVNEPFVITNPAFSKAIWDIYLGPNNIGESIKRGLVSRL